MRWSLRVVSPRPTTVGSKYWAEDTLPKLKEHLEEANDLKAKIDQVAEAKDTKKSDDRAVGDDNAMDDDAKRERVVQ